MKMHFLYLFLFFFSLQSAAQDAGECFCDTSFHVLQEGTNRTDSINWKSIKCFHSKPTRFQRLRGIPNVKLSVYYTNGKRQGTYVEYHQVEYFVVVPQFGYQQKAPRRYNIWKDAFRKSIYGTAVHGTYKNGLKEGVWISYDTNQRIIREQFFLAGKEAPKEAICNGLKGNYFLFRGDTDSIMRHVTNAENGTYTFRSDDDECTYNVKDGKLNGSVRNYVQRRKEKLLLGDFHFDDNCLSDSSIRYSITGDTTRIETNFQLGVPYTIVSYTSSSRSETIYRAPLYSYESGLIVLERKKAPRITKP